MSLVAVPTTSSYFNGTRTAVVRAIGGSTLTVESASSPSDWTTETGLTAQVNITPIAAVTLVNGDVVMLSELETINADIDNGHVAVALRGYDTNTGAILFEADSANSELADGNDNQQFKGMRVVLKDLRLGPYLGLKLDYNAATTYGIGDMVFSNSTVYISIAAANLANTPASSPTKWAVSHFSAGDRLSYVRGATTYEMTSMVDGNADLPLPPDYVGGTTYALGEKSFSAGSTFISLAAGNVGHTPLSSPTWWAIWYSPKWTLRRYAAEINYGTTKISYAFTYTLVNDWGEEGPAADPVSIDADYGQTVSLHGHITTTASHYTNFRSGQAGYRIRYYGFVSDSQGLGEYRLIKESDELGSSSFVGAFGHWVTTKPADWTDALSTTAFDLPPDNPLAIAGGPNGMLGIITQDHFAVSEPYRGWAWPERYKKALPFRGVGLMDAPGGWLVTTKHRAYAVSGPIPEQLHMEKLALEQAGISQQAMCSLGEAGIAYASNDGIVIVQGLGATLASGTLFTRKEWRARYASLLDKMRLGYHDGKLVCLFPGTDQSEASNYQGFVIRFDEGTPMYARLSVNGSGLGVDALNDQLLIANLTGFCEFETGGWLPLTWQSKEFRLPGPLNFGALQCEYTGGPVGIDLHGDGVNRATLTFPFSAARTKVTQRLPSGYKAAIYSAYIYRGTATTYSTLTTYALGAVVQNGAGNIYVSLQAANLNHTPDLSPTWWELHGEQNVHQVQIASTPLELRGQ